jgi:hypothetical protein
VHRLQGEAEDVKPTELLQLVTECYEERLALTLRHQAAARVVGNTDFNNTYQYIIAREDTHLSWLQTAIEALGGVVPSSGTEPALAARSPEAVTAIIREDSQAAQRFVEKWQPRIEHVTDARIRGTLRVMVGEMLEHKRFFEQAAAGREDLLGRRLDAGPRRGAVMSSRWVGE